MILLLFTNTVAAANNQNLQPIAITALDDTPVYNKAIADPANVISSVKYGTWFVNYKLANGWIANTLDDGSKVYLSAKHIATYIPHADFMRNHQVAAPNGYVFATPSSKSKVRAIIPNGGPVFSFGVSGDFYFVSFLYNNQHNIGFISKNVVKNLPAKQPPKPAQLPINVNEALLYSNDGSTFLGKLTSNKYNAESVCNTYGTFGSKYSATSIWNQYGTYGSKYSTESAFNQLTITPPIIVSNGKIIGYLTVNTMIQNAISPYGVCK